MNIYSSNKDVIHCNLLFSIFCATILLHLNAILLILQIQSDVDVKRGYIKKTLLWPLTAETCCKIYMTYRNIQKLRGRKKLIIFTVPQNMTLKYHIY
jgi:hypothetical protein